MRVAKSGHAPADPLEKVLRQLAACKYPRVAKWAQRLLRGDRGPARRPAAKPKKEKK